jgi:hypothetical protein
MLVELRFWAALLMNLEKFLQLPEKTHHDKVEAR